MTCSSVPTFFQTMRGIAACAAFAWGCGAHAVNVYPASELPIPGVSGDTIVQAAKRLDADHVVSLPNLVFYPHHASGTVETRAAMSQLVVDNLAAHFAARPLLTPV